MIASGPTQTIILGLDPRIRPSAPLGSMHAHGLSRIGYVQPVLTSDPRVKPEDDERGGRA